MFKKIFAILLIILTITFSTTLSFNKAHASSFADVPGYLDDAFASVIIAGLTIGAAGAHATTYINDNLESIRDTAIETYHDLAPEVKANFDASIASANERISIAEDWLTSFLAKYQTEVTAKDIPMTYSNNRFYFEGYQINFNHFSGRNLTLDGSWYLKLDDASTLAVSSSYRDWVDPLPSTYEIDYQTIVPNAWSQLQSNPSFINLINFISYFGTITITNLADSTTYEPGGDLTFADINDRLRNTDIPTGQLDNIYYPEPIPYTANGNRLYQNDLTGQLTLDDGTIYTGDVNWSIPNTTVREVEIDGVITAVPTTTTSTGDVVNVITGEIVIPAEIDTTPGATSPDAMKDDLVDKNKKWGALVTTKFPFSLPWDFYFILSFLAAESKTPIWDIKFDYDRYYDKPISFQINLSFLDPYMPFFRTFIVLGFAYALILNTQRLLGGAK